VLLGSAALRFIDLQADPAPSIPADILTDEGWWSRNARQAALFGATPLDEFNPALYSAPVYNAVLTLAFRAGGVSFATARAVAASAGMLALVIAGLLSLRYSGHRAAVWTVVLLGFAGPYVLHNRTAFVESFLIFMLMATVAATAAGVRKGGWYFVAGALAALTFWTKPNAAYILALPVLTVLFPPGGRSARWRGSLAILLLGAGLGSLPLVLLVVGPHWQDWLATNQLLSKSYVGSVWTALPTGLLLFPRNQFWGDAAPVAALCFGSCLMSFRTRERGSYQEPREVWLSRLASWWFALAAVSTMILPYQPVRRMLTLLPPLCLLAGLAMARRRRGSPSREGSTRPEKVPAPLRRWIEVLLLLWPVTSLLWGGWVASKVLWAALPARWALGGQVGGVSAALLLLATVFAAAVLARTSHTEVAYDKCISCLTRLAGAYPLWLLLRWASGRWKEFGGASDAALLVPDIAVALAILGLSAWMLRFQTRGSKRGHGARSQLGWQAIIARPAVFGVIFAVANTAMLLCLGFPSYTMGEMGARVESIVPRDTVLVGSFADAVGFETGLQTVEVRPHFEMNEDPFQRWPDAILVTAVRHELQLGEHVPGWAPSGTVPILDLPLCPDPWTGEPRFILRLRATAQNASK
jgi:4-amino-4-deoxy-L-arabinose transferase-like glycosyltransferase